MLSTCRGIKYTPVERALAAADLSEVKALDTVRRRQQKVAPQLKGMRWTLLKDADKLNLAQLIDLEVLVSQYTTKRTARAWLYREQLRDILERKQINIVSAMLQR